MDLALLSAMVEEARRGSRVDGSWTTQGYNNIVMALHEVGMHTITKNHVKNRQKSLKDRWREVHDLFSSLSGFAWNQSSKKIEAEDEVWDSLIQAKPSAGKWRVNSIHNYDLMRSCGRMSELLEMGGGHLDRQADMAQRKIYVSI
ncbi:L10-interacting MYB domain-containing protein-like [Phaseolus vulgaris]|uniref:L10-interacting MYB domain-containing protein-like n=1 Tax=Phaseolus vulgaris TaxID=3885 RepID=UPI0035CC729C